MNINSRPENEQNPERTTTADLAGVTTEQPSGTTEQRGPAGAYGNGATQPDGGNGHAAGTPSQTATATEEATQTPLLQQSESESLHKRWTDVQSNFVDDPRRAVQDADALVAELMQKLAKMFADERGKLEQEWDRGGEVSTEDLRTALRRYRSFFERLLSV
jgi:hypothetical protein